MHSWEQAVHMAAHDQLAGVKLANPTTDPSHAVFFEPSEEAHLSSEVKSTRLNLFRGVLQVRMSLSFTAVNTTLQRLRQSQSRFQYLGEIPRGLRYLPLLRCLECGSLIWLAVQGYPAVQER